MNQDENLRKQAYVALMLSFSSLGRPDSIEEDMQRGRILLHATHALFDLMAGPTDPAKGGALLQFRPRSGGS